MIDFKARYNRQEYLSFFRNHFLPEDFGQYEENIAVGFQPQYMQNIVKIGEVPSLELSVYEVEHTSENDPRVSLSRESFRLLAYYGIKRALIIFISKKSANFRISLVTIDLKWKEGTRVQKEYSNPRRYSFFVGPDAKINTPSKYLINKGRIKSFDDLKERFSIEVVNKEFYTNIAILFTKLVGGERKVGSKSMSEAGCLRLPSTSDDTTKKEFAVRLIGRLIFCWFLKKKQSANALSLIPEEILSSGSIAANPNYYHSVLEPLFFEALNKPMNIRSGQVKNGLWAQIPFLNGGLFARDRHDYYDPGFNGVSKNINTLIVPDGWLNELFSIFETYNFTIDENTSVDVELSIDPEMLGRIFENLLAEINPETGETARKSTGSYYTPRAIVEYMVDESLKQYLTTKTTIAENKLSALLAYGIEEREEDALSEQEKNLVIKALDEIKIIDPACGSGAFPMGMLQKMLLILQKIDPESKKWLSITLAKIENQIVKKEAERKLSNENWNYVHKLGIIQNSIYGVDIQQIAVEISKLRFFLSLIVDEKIDDSKENRAVEPLPNLEFKFVCANSLIGLPHHSEANLHESQEDIHLLKQLRDEYIRSYGEYKKQIEQKFLDTQNKMFKNSLSWYDPNSQTSKLSQWNPFSGEPCAWFDPDWMFGIKDGFDIVIANPPYLESRSSLFSNALKDSLKLEMERRWSRNSHLINRSSDLLIYFLGNSINLINSKGSIVFITQNSWLDTEYGKNFQTFLMEHTNVKAIIDSNYKYFDSSTGPNINTIISFFQCNNPTQNNAIFFIRTHDDVSKGLCSLLKIFTSKLSNDSSDIRKYVYSDPIIHTTKWGILLYSDKNVIRLISILNSKAKYLNDLKNTHLSIGQGLNLSKSYEVDENILIQYPELKTAIIPYMTNHDGAPFCLKKTNRFILDRKNISKKLALELESDCVKIFDFSSTRKTPPILILPRGIGRHFCSLNLANAFTSSYVEIYDDSYNCAQEMKYNLWLFLNSSIAWLLREISGRKNLGGGMLKAEAVDLKSFPIYMDFKATKKIDEIFSKTKSRDVNDILTEIDTCEHREIDEIVFDYLELSEEEKENIITSLKQLIIMRVEKSRT